MEPFTMISQEEGSSAAGLMGTFRSSKEWIKVSQGPLLVRRPCVCKLLPLQYDQLFGLPVASKLEGYNMVLPIRLKLMLTPSSPNPCPLCDPHGPLPPPIYFVTPMRPPPQPTSNFNPHSPLTTPPIHCITPPQERHAGVRPWSEFLSIHRISKPKSSGDAIKRLFGNISRFQSNYLFVFLGLVLYCM